MKLFQELGEEVEKIWRDENYSEDKFPDIAANALKEANLPEKVSAWEVAEWTLKQTTLPDQRDVHGNFGDPPITLYNSPRFHVDVYFWLEGTTAIHQHSFCGAFQVLHGSSIHSWYEFERKEAINALAEIGDISLKTVELLEVGDIQQILAGRQYIHGLFHLEQPSATIVVRTHKSPLYLPQFSYHKPSLAIDPFFEEPNSTKKIQVITALLRSKHPDTDRLITELLNESDFQTTFAILSTVRHHLQQDQIEQMFELSSPRDRFDLFVQTVKKRHGEKANILPEVFEHEKKVSEIVKRRSYINDPEHRFFLALLMNVDGKERILSLIKSRFPDKDPIDKILDWTFDLAQTRVIGLKIPNALGIEDFADLDVFILECLLKDMSDEQIRESFEAEYPNEKLEDFEERITDKTQNIRQSIIFQPLLD